MTAEIICVFVYYDCYHIYSTDISFAALTLLIWQKGYPACEKFLLWSKWRKKWGYSMFVWITAF